MLVGVLGATGYTGRLVAAELAGHAVTARLGGRDTTRLAVLPLRAGGARVRVDTTDSAALRGFLTGLDVLISCVGPFTELGAAVVDAAVEQQVPYLDSTGEPGFIAGVLRRHRDAATPVVPACGVDYIPSDLAVAIAAATLAGRTDAAVTQVLVGYRLSAVRPSRGTARSAAAALATAPVAPSVVTLPFRAATVPGVVLPWGEQVLLAHRLPGVAVRTAFAVAPLTARLVGGVATVNRGWAPLLRAGAPLLRRLADRLPDGPAPDARDAARIELVVQVTTADADQASVELELRDVYATTARLLVSAALHVSQPGTPAGAATPAQVLPAADFLTSTAVKWTVR